MDWLKKLPVVGPYVTRLMTTHAWRSYERLDRVKWTRLAAAMTFISFVALFPLLTLGAAIAAATLSKSQQNDLQDKIEDQIPGIADKLDLNSLVENAGAVGLIAGVLLLFTGMGWVNQMRDCLRAVWELPDKEENPVLSKAKDAGILVGLGGASWSPSPSRPSPPPWSAGSSTNSASTRTAGAASCCGSSPSRSPSSPTSWCCSTSSPCCPASNRRAAA